MLGGGGEGGGGLALDFKIFWDCVCPLPLEFGHRYSIHGLETSHVTIITRFGAWAYIYPSFLSLFEH